MDDMLRFVRNCSMGKLHSHWYSQDQTSCILYLARSRLARSRLAQTLSVTAVWTCRCSPLGTTTLYGPSHSFRTLTSSTNRSKQEYKQQLRHNCLSGALHSATKAKQFEVAALAERWRKHKLRLPGITSFARPLTSSNELRANDFQTSADRFFVIVSIAFWSTVSGRRIFMSFIGPA